MKDHHMKDHHMKDHQRREELADFLRTRRARLTPAEVGLPSGTRRRTPGLRREEVADLAGVGLTWYTWLEQAREIRASEDVLERLVCTLHLDSSERNHLFQLADQSLPAPLSPLEEAVPESLQRMIDGMEQSPAYVMGRRWDILAWNQAACDIFGDYKAMAPENRNAVWLTFTSPDHRRLHVAWECYAQSVLAKFRVNCGRCPDDPYMQEMVERLKTASPEFRLWWPRHDVRDCTGGLKTLNHPVQGRMTLEYIGFQVPPNPDLRLVVHTRLSETATPTVVPA